MGQPVVHWEIGGRDGTKLHEFYRTLFDWTIQVMPEFHYGMVDTGGQGGINGGISTLPAEVPPVASFVTVSIGPAVHVFTVGAMPDAVTRMVPTHDPTQPSALPTVRSVATHSTH